MISTKKYQLTRLSFYSLGLPDRFRNEWKVSNYLFLFPEAEGSFFLWRKGGEVDL